MLCFSLVVTTQISAFPVSYASEAVSEQKSGEWKPVDFTTILQEKVEVSKIPEGNAYIPKDTVLNMELQTEISSKTAKEGDDVPLVMTDNIIINDITVIPSGSRVNAKVTKVSRSGMFGRAGKLEFMIDSVETLNGVRIPLEYAASREAGSDDGAIAVAAAVSVIGGLFMKGKNVSFPAGSKFSAKVIEDTDLKVSLEQLAEVMDPAKPHGVSITIR